MYIGGFTVITYGNAVSDSLARVLLYANVDPIIPSLFTFSTTGRVVSGGYSDSLFIQDATISDCSTVNTNTLRNADFSLASNITINEPGVYRTCAKAYHELNYTTNSSAVTFVVLGKYSNLYLLFVIYYLLFVICYLLFVICYLLTHSQFLIKS